jgi:hypothetical protein
LAVVAPACQDNAEQTAKLLGFAEHDIPILTSGRLLLPLGKPTPNAPKWFCTCEIISLVADRDWLSKATQILSRHCRRSRVSKRMSAKGTS